MGETLDAKIRQKRNQCTNLTNLNTKRGTLATAAKLKTEQDKNMKTGAFNSGCFYGKNLFCDDSLQTSLFISQY